MNGLDGVRVRVRVRDRSVLPSSLPLGFESLIATPPWALFAIGTPILAAIVAADDEVAVVGDVLAALSLTSAPVLVAAALQVVLLPRFASVRRAG